MTYENNNEFQAINEFGMTKIKEGQYYNDENLSELLITITKTDYGISLKGLKGTAWIDLSFLLKNSQKQMINQLGMTK